MPVVVCVICLAFPAAVKIQGLPAVIPPSATRLTVPPLAIPVNAEPSTAGSLAEPSNCTALFADVPASNVDTLPRPNVVLWAAAFASSSRALPALVKSYVAAVPLPVN